MRLKFLFYKFNFGNLIKTDVLEDRDIEIKIF